MRIARLFAFSLVAVGCASEPVGIGSVEREVDTCVTYVRGGAGTVADSSIWQGTPTVNGGAALNLWTGATSSGTARALVRWDLSSIPATATVTSASVTVYASNATLTTVRVHRATAAWGESTVNWNNFAGAFDPAVAASFTTGGYGNRTFSIQSLAQDWVSGASPNHGLLFEEDPTTVRTGYGSSENGTLSRRPSLTLCYSDGPPVPPPPPPPPPPPGSPSFKIAVIGDYGALGPGLQEVSEMVRSWKPDAILTTGDNVYSDAAEPYDEIVGQYYRDFIYPYSGAYGTGAPTNKFWPTLGNHDWDHGTAYADFFQLPHNERYYDVALEPGDRVRFFAVDSDHREPDGRSASSVQASWIQSRLAASTACFDLVAFHEPPYGSRLGHDNLGEMAWPFPAWGADIVFAGHKHGYERVSVGGFPYITIGTAGGGIWGNWTNISPDSVYRYPVSETGWGAVLVTITVGSGSGQLVSEFWPVDATQPADTLSFTKYCP